MDHGVHGLVDHLFRHSAGQMVATLTRILGSSHLGLAEEVVQEALLTAMQQWTLRGIPDNPRAWLFQVARNRALDQIRRADSLRGKEAQILASLRQPHEEELPSFAHELRDDQLRMMFMCSHPALQRESRIALTLKTVGGFSVDEIARAFLMKKETIAQRLVRARRQIRDEAIAMEMPGRGELPERLDSLLDAVYLIFNEGYSAHAGEDLVRSDLCHEAIRLAGELATHPATARPDVDALLSLLLLQGARLPARVDAAGELATLEQQDRSLWDQSMIAAGLRALERSASGDRLTPYHVEAAIASVHSIARSFEATDWPSIVRHYEHLLAIKPSPVVALNRAVALAMVDGAAAGIAAVGEIAGHPALRDYLPLATTLADLSLRAGDRVAAAAHFTRALELPGSLTEKRYILKRLESLGRP